MKKEKALENFPESITRTELSKIVGVTPRTIRGLFEKKSLCTEKIKGDGDTNVFHYPFPLVLQDYIALKTKGETEETLTVKERYNLAKAEAAEMNASEQSGNLCKKDDSLFILNSILTIFKQEQLAIEKTLPPILAAMTDPKEIKEEIKKALRSTYQGYEKRVDDLVRKKKS